MIWIFLGKILHDMDISREFFLLIINIPLGESNILLIYPGVSHIRWCYPFENILFILFSFTFYFSLYFNPTTQKQDNAENETNLKENPGSTD